MIKIIFLKKVRGSEWFWLWICWIYHRWQRWWCWYINSWFRQLKDFIILDILSNYGRGYGSCYHDETKIYSYELFSKSPSAYEFLRKLFLFHLGSTLHKHFDKYITFHKNSFVKPINLLLCFWKSIKKIMILKWTNWCCISVWLLCWYSTSESKKQKSWKN